MKKIILALCILIALGTLNNSCTKYPDGPSFTLLTKTQRLARTWKISQVMSNGTDVTSTFTALAPNYTETYDKAGNYSYSSNYGSGSGKWEFSSDKMQIKVTGVSGQSSRDQTILKLKNSDLWYTIKNGNVTDEYHFVAK